MNRIVFWLALLGLAFLVWRFVQLAQRKQRRWRDRQARSPGADDPAAPPPQARIAPGETMLRCAHCGVYLPESEALTRAGRSFCSAEHRDAPAP